MIEFWNKSHYYDCKKNCYPKWVLINTLESFTDKENVFIELSENNDIAQSNIYYLEKAKNWREILIEPAPHKLMECRANRVQNN